LSHPNIATIFDLQESASTRFFVMEYVAGDTLAQRIQRGPLQLDDALEITKQIADALEAAHEKGIVHRNLKPANVKITLEGK
jgi:serine/threonine-protein kinase